MFLALFPDGLTFTPARSPGGGRQIWRIEGTANLVSLVDAPSPDCVATPVPPEGVGNGATEQWKHSKARWRGYPSRLRSDPDGIRVARDGAHSFRAVGRACAAALRRIAGNRVRSLLDPTLFDTQRQAISSTICSWTSSKEGAELATRLARAFRPGASGPH